MTQHEQVADFIQRRVTLGRVQPGTDYRFMSYYGMPHYGAPLPTVEQAGEDLFQDAAFRGLQLGGLLNRPTGEFIEQAVELVVPRVLAPEFDLIVAALRYASARQQGETRAKALLAIGGSILFSVMLKEFGKAA